LWKSLLHGSIPRSESQSSDFQAVGNPSESLDFATLGPEIELMLQPPDQIVRVRQSLQRETADTAPNYQEGENGDRCREHYGASLLI